MRLARFDAKTGEPMPADKSKKDDEKYFLPFSVSDELTWTNEGVLRFSHDGELPAAYSLFYDEKAPHKTACPQNIPLVGTGDALRLGVKGEARELSTSIRGLFDLWDGDGKLDLIWDNVNARLFKNVSKKDDATIRFADRGNLVRERLVQHNNAPFLVDWNGDGKPDVFIGTEAGRIYYFDR